MVIWMNVQLVPVIAMSSRFSVLGLKVPGTPIKCSKNLNCEIILRGIGSGNTFEKLTHQLNLKYHET